VLLQWRDVHLDNEAMTIRILSLIPAVIILAGCAPSAATTQPAQSPDMYARNAALLDQAEETAKRNEALIARAELQANRVEAQAARINTLLTKWEEQQRRVDAILTRMEARKP
jgi:uncharacterized lipoprotein YajG